MTRNEYGNGDASIISVVLPRQLQFFLILFFLLSPSATPLTFNFSSFPNGINTISLEGDAYIDGKFLRLTKSAVDDSQFWSVGRATYSQPFLLRENATGKLADFTTDFTFVIDSQRKTDYADGLALFLAPNGSLLNRTLSRGASLGLPVENTLTISRSQYPFVAVEFDIFHNIEPGDPPGDHVGIDVDSLKSNITTLWNGSIATAQKNSARISYDSTSKNLSVAFTSYVNCTQVMRYLHYIIDLNKHLPDLVIVGLSAGTGALIAAHKINSWRFNSTSLLHPENIATNKTSSSSSSSGLLIPAPSPGTNPSSGNDKIRLTIGVSISGCVMLVGGLGLVWFILWRRKRAAGECSDEDPIVRDIIDNEFEKGTGPRKFSYSELARATSNFQEGEKLGEGGFGGVYRGFIKDLNSFVAVKRISSGSRQGMKEYAAEVRIISQLRHRNLVQLIGWCHEKKLLLVYEFMPNGSLDSHLFKEKSPLTWDVRYKIALGLASGLLYLHEEWEQCVLHRDIKSSNVMLDSNFNPKLGDFGLARLVDHGKQSQTTIVAGTRGYMAQEYVTTGKASKGSDVYSFGVVALEIACGRKPIDLSLEGNEINMVEWIWKLYGEGKVIEAADPKLCGDFDEKQMKCLMMVGMWCAHPDYNMRPSIQQAIQVLNSEVPWPILPLEMPVATFPLQESFLIMSKNTTGSEASQIESSYGYSTNSLKTQSTSSSATNSHPSISI